MLGTSLMIFLRVSADTPGLSQALAKSLPKVICLADLRQKGLRFARFGRGYRVATPDHAIVAASRSNVAPARQQPGDCRDRRHRIGGPGGLVLGLLNGIFDLLALVALAFTVGLHCGKCGLDTEWLQPGNNLLRDGSIDPHPAKPDAVTDRLGAKLPTANVSLCVATLASILNMQASAAAGASEQAR